MKHLLLFCSILVFFVACTGGGNLKEEIATLEQEVLEAADVEKMKTLTKKYKTYLSKNPEDSLNNPVYLKKLSDLELRIGNAKEAALALQQAIKDYPDYQNTDKNIMGLAAILMNNLREIETPEQIKEIVANTFTDNNQMNARLVALIEGQKSLIFDEQSNSFNKQATMSYVNLCELYGAANPDKEESPNYLFQAAEMSRTLNQYNRAISIYDKIYAQFPDFDKAPQALFLKAFTLDNDLKQYDEARSVYEDFLAKHPEDPFADDTQFLLEKLGKTDDEIIKDFEQ